MNTLIIVDVQNDFAPWGALPVKNADQVVPVINELQNDFDLIVATQDWHPKDHKSFASNHDEKNPGDLIVLGETDQVLWPDHCVQGEEGADFIKELDISRLDHVFKKGVQPGVDSYSGFFDNDHKTQTGLGAYLKERSVAEVTIVGLATDYCVKFTALDAKKLGFNVTVKLAGCRGVELNVGDIEAAIGEMKAAGINVVE